MTKQQAAALAKLRELQAAGFKLTAQGNFKTGINTTTLHGLCRDGFITCRYIYLRGIVTSDLVIK